MKLLNFIYLDKHNFCTHEKSIAEFNLQEKGSCAWREQSPGLLPSSAKNVFLSNQIYSFMNIFLIRTMNIL